MKNLIAAAILCLIFLAAQCEQPEPVVIDCGDQIDSLNEYWIGVVKNIQFTDTNFVNDTTYIIKDSVSIRYIDSLNIIDSTLIDTILVAPVETIELFPVEVKVDSVMDWQTLNEAAGNLTDEFIFIDRNIDQGTRWAVQGYPHAAMLHFDTLYVITEVWFNTFGWNENFNHTIEVYHYDTLLKTIVTKSELWSKHKLFYVGEHLYFNIIGGKNSYTDIGGIRIFGYKL